MSDTLFTDEDRAKLRAIVSVANPGATEKGIQAFIQWAEGALISAALVKRILSGEIEPVLGDPKGYAWRVSTRPKGRGGLS